MKATAKLAGDDQLVKVQAEDVSAVKATDISALKIESQGDASVAKIEQLTASLIEKMQNTFESLVKVNSDTSNQNAGRDLIANSSNDTGLMEFIIDKFWLIFVAMIAFMKWELLRQDKNYRNQIKQLQAEKEDYKSRFLTQNIHTEEEYRQFRAEHDKIKEKAHEDIVKKVV